MPGVTTFINTVLVVCIFFNSRCLLLLLQ